MQIYEKWSDQEKCAVSDSPLLNRGKNKAMLLLLLSLHLFFYYYEYEIQ